MRDPRQPSLGGIYASILLTYLRRPWPWFWSLLIVGGLALGSSSVPTNFLLKGATPTLEMMYDNLVISTLFLSVACAHAAAFSADQTSRLLAVPHGFLTPRLRGPAIVIAILFTLLAIILPLVFWPHPMLPAARHHFPLYAGAIAAVVAAELSWMQIVPSLVHLGPAAFVAGLLPWVAFILPSVRHAFVQMLVGELPLLAAALYAIAAILFITLWIVLANRRQVNAPRFFPSTARAAQTPIPANEIPRLHITASPWRRFRLRAFLTAAGGRDGFFGALVGALLAILAVSIQHFYGHIDPGAPLALSLVISVLTPIIVASRTTALRPAMLVHDILLPHSRREFARDYGLAIFANHCSFWASAQITLVLSYAILAPADLRLYGRSFAFLLPISAAFQLFFFGLLAWFLSFRPSFLSGIALFTIAMGLVPVNISFFDRAKPLVSTSIASAVAMLVAGIVLIVTALRRWTRCEIT
ncbi:MAG: hypothetical protein JWN40_3101 [Phycisphaerales bacterium]|nr:hypothetical protein [Phycisphaerales bacterium]